MEEAEICHYESLATSNVSRSIRTLCKSIISEVGASTVDAPLPPQSWHKCMQSVKCQVKDVNQTALYTPDLVAAMSDVPNRSTRRLRTQIACYTCRRGKRKVSIALQRGSPIRYLITLHSVTASNQFAHYVSVSGRNACMPQRFIPRR